MADHKSFRVERRMNLGMEHELASRGGLQRVMAPPDWTTIQPQVRDATDLGYDVLLTAEIPNDPYLPIARAVPHRQPTPRGNCNA
jgi:hypothetical protein